MSADELTKARNLKLSAFWRGMATINGKARVLGTYEVFNGDYRKAFDDKGVHPSDLKQLSDLAKFPFTLKSDLRDNYPFGLFAVPREQLSRIHASSGTTGKPTVVGYTAGDIDRWADLVARSIRAAGGRRGDLIHVAYGYGLFTGGLGAHYGAERLGCTVIPMSGGQTEKQVQMIRDLEPSIIMVTPSYMQVIIEEFVRQGVDPRASSLKVGIFGAEPWTEAMRREIEDKGGIDAVDNALWDEAGRLLGEERRASRVAGAIVAARGAEPLDTTLALSRVIEKAIGDEAIEGVPQHPAVISQVEFHGLVPPAHRPRIILEMMLRWISLEPPKIDSFR